MVAPDDECKYPLGKRGPRTLISYSFTEPRVALRLGEHLVEQGFQVTLFDRSSLVGARLHETLARAVTEAEVVVQLYATAEESAGMRQELELAMSRVSEPGFRLVAVSLFDHRALPEPIRQIAYIDGISVPEAAWWRDVERASLGCLALLPVDAANPFMLDDTSCRAVLDEGAKVKRVLVDSGGLLLRCLCEYRREVARSPKQAPDFAAKMAEYLAFTQRRLALLDHVAGRVIDEIRGFYASWGSSSAMEGAEAIRRFWRLTVGLYLLRGAEEEIGMGPLQAHADEALADIRRRQRGQTDVDFGRYWWAMEWPHGMSRPGDWLDLDFVGPPGTDIGRAFFPQSRLLPGTVPIRANPRDGFRPRDWPDYIVPQLGRQAFAADDPKAIGALPWKLDQIRWFGLN